MGDRSNPGDIRAAAGSGAGGPSGELKRKLTQRQLSMIAIGGAIGVGLFLGSSVTIRLAGPGVILSYVLSAVVALVVAYSVAEMAVVHPVSGSFGVYAQTYLSDWAGFAVRATYGFVQIVAIGAEVTAVAIYCSFWFPSAPQWVWVVSVSVALVALNAMQVGHFAEFEYWFAVVKVIAIVLFILVGLALIFGIGHSPAVGFSNLTARGGFMPRGWTGIWLALALTLTSYMGVEIIGITAGEAERPQETIPKAMRTIAFRLIIFYLLAMIVMLALTPWNRMGSGITGSPFVLAFAMAGIPYAAGIMNLVVITAALSSANTDLYLTTRMLFSLARGGYLPNAFGRLSGNGVPHRALFASTGGMIAAILLAIFMPNRAFLSLYSIAIAGMFFVWGVILLTHIAFRRALGPARIAALPLRLMFSPIPEAVCILALGAIALSTFYVDGLRYALPSFAPFLLLLSIVYWRLRKGKGTEGGRGPRGAAI